MTARFRWRLGRRLLMVVRRSSSYTACATAGGPGVPVVPGDPVAGVCVLAVSPFSPIVMPGLVNGQAYTVTVFATNAAGEGPAGAGGGSGDAVDGARRRRRSCR